MNKILQINNNLETLQLIKMKELLNRNFLFLGRMI